MKIYAIKDTKIGAFKTPFYSYNDQVAIRSLKNAINDKTAGELYQNPEDFQLYTLGEFNDLTGDITSKVEFVANAIDLKKGE